MSDRYVFQEMGHDSLVDLALAQANRLDILREELEDARNVVIHLERVAWEKRTTGVQDTTPRGPRRAQAILDDTPEPQEEDPHTPEADQSRSDVPQTENDSQQDVSYLEAPAHYAQVDGELTRVRRRFRDHIGDVWVESPWNQGSGLYFPEDRDTLAPHRPQWVEAQWGPITSIQPIPMEESDDDQHA